MGVFGWHCQRKRSGSLHHLQAVLRRKFGEFRGCHAHLSHSFGELCMLSAELSDLLRHPATTRMDKPSMAHGEEGLTGIEVQADAKRQGPQGWASHPWHTYGRAERQSKCKLGRSFTMNQRSDHNPATTPNHNTQPQHPTQPQRTQPISASRR